VTESENPASPLDHIVQRRVGDTSAATVDGTESVARTAADAAEDAPTKSAIVQRLVRQRLLKRQGILPGDHGHTGFGGANSSLPPEIGQNLKQELLGDAAGSASKPDIIKALVKEGLIYGVVYKGAPELRVQTEAAHELLESIGVKIGYRSEGGRVINRESLKEAAGGFDHMLNKSLYNLKTNKRPPSLER
jgi:hypothetical protein